MADFFAHQDRARRNTRVLLVLMALAVLGISLAFYFALVFYASWNQGVVAFSWWQPQTFLLSISITLIVVLGASLMRTWSLRGGGRAVAEMLGGEQISPHTKDPLERRLINVVEEMAIASGLPVPQVFVLREQGINAFAAGFRQDDAAVAVTRGALRVLSRDELQGVIAHEFSHILNGDMRLNIRLMGIVFGILLHRSIRATIDALGMVRGDVPKLTS